jgi:hypothetical protein
MSLHCPMGGRLTLQRHLWNTGFYHKEFRVRKTPLPFVACDRKAAMLCVQSGEGWLKEWAGHQSPAPCDKTLSQGEREQKQGGVGQAHRCAPGY